MRLGSVERAIVGLLMADGGPVPRTRVVHALYPSLCPEQRGDDSWAVGDTTSSSASASRRALIDATVSRAIASLARKGLIVRERQRATGRTILRTVRVDAPMPDWENVARAEEDFAAQAASRAEQWRTLAGRARQRALRIREERRLDSTDDERTVDVQMAQRLRDDSHVSGERKVINAPRVVSLRRTALRLMRRRRGQASISMVPEEDDGCRMNRHCDTARPGETLR